MPRVPIRQQNQPYGTANITPNATNQRVAPTPIIKQVGPALPREVWTTHASLSPEVKRAIAQMQENIRQMASQIKALPHGNGNMLEGVPLVNGGASGAGPYTILKHGLRIPFRGYHILGIKNGSLTAHAVVANPFTNSNLLGPGAVNPLDAVQLQLWVQVTAFAAPPAPQPTADIWVYG